MSKAAVIFWSQTGNTEQMANAIADGIREGGMEVDVLNVADTTPADAVKYAKIALGCPAMGAEVLEETEFDPFFTELESKISGLKVALFGSYGWGDGQWMRDWVQRTTAETERFFVLKQIPPKKKYENEKKLLTN